MSLRPLRRFTPRLGAIRSALLAATLAALPLHLSLAQSPGDVDTSFGTDIIGSTIYTILPVVDVDTPQTDPDTGALIPLSTLTIGGDFGVLERAQFNGVGFQPSLTGAVDPGFGDGSRIIYTAQPDIYGAEPSKYFVGGLFGKGSNQPFPKSNIFRLNATFTLDSSFNVGQGANDYVTAILPTASGIVVGGLFDTFNNQTRHRIVRLRNDNVGQDGAIDPTFNPALDIDDNVLALAQQLDPATGVPNGQILVAGLFNSVNGQTRTKLARVNVDGTLDGSFAPSIDTRVDTVAVQPDGKILIGGDFNVVNGVAAFRIVRLNVDGTTDPTFQAAVTQNDSDNVNPVGVYTIVLLPDGRLYVGGNFITVNGTTRRYLALLNADGSVDTSFDPQRNITNAVQTIYPSPNGGDVYVGETVTRKVNNKFPPAVVALYGVPPLPVNTTPPNLGTTFPVPVLQPTQARVSVTPKGRVMGGANAAPARNGSFTITREVEDSSDELVVQLRVGGNARGTDAMIQGFPGTKPGSVITYTFAPGETTGKIMVMHRPNAQAGSKQLRLTVMNPQDGVTTYEQGDAPSAMLRVDNQ